MTFQIWPMIMKVPMIREDVIDSESFNALPEIDIGAEVSGSDILQFSSEYTSLPLLSSSRTRSVAIPKPLG
jgi:hypothetical protein